MNDYKNLVKAAIDAKSKALPRYSDFYVGAAILTDNGKIYSGCNIESSSYSLTICAERTAIFKALSEGERNFKAIAVDTHVFRVSARLGLTTNAKTPLAAEKQLVKNIPVEKINRAHHWLILHGRYVCQARKPKCDLCGLQHFCKYYNKNNPL